MSNLDAGAILRSKGGRILIVAAVVAVALAGRLVSLGYNFDGDEIFSLQLINGSWREVIVRSLADKPHPPLHNILLHEWATLWGVSETKLRSLSVLLSIAAIILSMDILLRRVRAFGAFAGGMTIALSAFFAYYSQEARPYALIFLAGAFNIRSFLDIFGDPKRPRNVILWAASAAIMVWSHYVGAICLAVEGCLLLVRHPPRVALRAILPALATGATILPWMWLAFHNSRELHELAWNLPPALREFPYFYLGAIGWPPVVSGWFLLFAVMLIFLFGMLRTVRVTKLPWDEIALGAIAILPPSTVFALSLWTGTSIWATRQLIPSALAFILLLFILMNSLPRKLCLVAEGIIVAWAAAGFTDSLQGNRVPHWREIVQRIAGIDSNGIILADEPWTVRPLLYYSRNSGLQVMHIRADDDVLPNGNFFVVCRHIEHADPCDRLLRLASRGAKELARDPWDTAGGKPRDIVFTYRIAR